MQRSRAPHRWQGPAASGDTTLTLPARSASSLRGAAGRVRARGVSGDVHLLVAWAAIGAGAVDNHYSTVSIALLVLGCSLVWATQLRRRAAQGWCGAMVGYGLATGVAALAAVTLARPSHADHSWLVASELLLASAAALAVAALASGRARYGHVTVLAVGVSCIAMIRADPSPAIDVWHMLQAATQGLSHGRDIYSVPWRDPWTGRHFQGYAYLPGSAVLLWPFQLVLGDVRYGLVVAVVATAYLLGAAAPKRWKPAVMALAALYPELVVGVDRSWVDPLVVATAAGAALAAERGHRGWATILLALCLSTKQTAWLLLPMAAVWPAIGWRRALVAAAAAAGLCLPWLIANPAAFYQNGFAYNAAVAARADSLSLYPLALEHGMSPGMLLVAAVTLVAIVVALRTCSRDAFGFFLGSAAIVIVFNLVNKQTFYNEWYLAAGLVLAAVAHGGQRSGGEAGSRQNRSTVSAM